MRHHTTASTSSTRTGSARAGWERRLTAAPARPPARLVRLHHLPARWRRAPSVGWLGTHRCLPRAAAVRPPLPSPASRLWPQAHQSTVSPLLIRGPLLPPPTHMPASPPPPLLTRSATGNSRGAARRGGACWRRGFTVRRRLPLLACPCVCARACVCAGRAIAV